MHHLGVLCVQSISYIEANSLWVCDTCMIKDTFLCFCVVMPNRPASVSLLIDKCMDVHTLGKAASSIELMHHSLYALHTCLLLTVLSRTQETCLPMASHLQADAHPCVYTGRLWSGLGVV